jgi:hypothetical protein
MTVADVLTEASPIACGHPKGVVQTKGDAKLQVAGSPVLTKDGIDKKSISGCLVPDDTSKGTQHCSKVTSVNNVEATKLQVNGKPVALDTLSGMTDGLPTSPAPTMAATANQGKLTAV